ncbi:hypothetical protein N7497_004925 [Penicillium chrysogenum]|jgi:hypothetical protein|uniref:DUF7770 domain-containing protein n=1 Tax=Penicillium chrysogenum TaxID=5076 RepID=A0ABQ8WPF2_PENCH|nr:hypothetical protein N7505_002870 [Penicillium chrysogenum]KAJ6156040.1 hypothetical protein N7497_004925 [Penicillium chrysogenum]
MATFQPVHFVPKNRQEEILALPVTQILAVPHSQNSGTNHWCLYLSVSPKTSVQFDCQPSYSAPSSILQGGSKAHLIVSELACKVPDDAQAEFIIDLIPGLSVSRIYNLLIGNGRHKYEFDANGVGCRFWTLGQIDLLHEVQFATNMDQITAARSAIRKLWPEQTPLALDQGAYYT